MTMIRAARTVLIQIAVIGIVSVLLLEAVVALSFSYPNLSPIPLDLVRYLHIRFDRGVIQVKPDCALYDSEVTYTLRPGTCTFGSREFDNEYRINTLGVRDTEEALDRPEIVVLGDSLAMGWGVEQQEAFPQVLARTTGRRTLNAGISSFGTARELLFLKRIDRSNLQHLVIQYTDNDFGENAQFASTGSLKILTEAEYQRTVEEQAELLSYWPGKYALNLLVQLRAAFRRQLEQQARAAEREPLEAEADAFVGVLEQAPVDLSAFRVTVAAVNADFLEAVRRRAARSPVAWVTEIELFAFGTSLSFPGAYYVLDDHPTQLGQAAIARDLAKRLGI